MFRITLSNHTRLSDIADSKANILLSVNAIIISIALSTLLPKLGSAKNEYLVVPTFIMLLFSVITIIFAILSTKPKVTSGEFTKEDLRKRKVNLLFFGNFYKMNLDDYTPAVREMMEDRDYLYDSMIRDLYYLGVVLNRKYRLLSITYQIFYGRNYRFCYCIRYIFPYKLVSLKKSQDTSTVLSRLIFARNALSPLTPGSSSTSSFSTCPER